MLYKNDELVVMDDTMKKRVYDELGIKLKDGKPVNPKFDMRIKQPESHYSKSEGNKKPDRPAFAVIPLNVQKEGPNGSEKWNYCQGRNKNTKNDTWIYFTVDNGSKQSHLQFQDSKTITSGSIDLMYFLLFLSPLREIMGETDEQKRSRGVKLNQRFQFVVENKEKEAALKMSGRTMKVRVEMAILETLKLAEIKQIASAFGIENVHDKGELTLRDELWNKVHMLETMGHKGYERFEELAKLDDLTEIKAVIQKAIDREVIKEDPKAKRFSYLNTEGKFSNAITGTSAGRTLRESLEHFMVQNPSEFDKLKVAVEEKAMVEA